MKQDTYTLAVSLLTHICMKLPMSVTRVSLVHTIYNPSTAQVIIREHLNIGLRDGITKLRCIHIDIYS